MLLTFMPGLNPSCLFFSTAQRSWQPQVFAVQFPLHLSLPISVLPAHMLCLCDFGLNSLASLKDYGFCPLGCAICFKELYLASITWALRPQASSQVSHLTCSLSQLFLPILWSECQMSLRFADDGYLKFCFQMISEKGLAGGECYLEIFSPLF